MERTDEHNRAGYLFRQTGLGQTRFEAVINYDRCSKGQVIEDLVAGEYVNSKGYGNVAGVFSMNFQNGRCKDVTEDFRRFFDPAFGIAAE